MKTIDMHCDTISVLLEKQRTGSLNGQNLRSNKMHLDLLRMKEADYLLQNFALFVDDHGCEDPWEEVCALYEVYKKEILANEDLIRPIYRYEDIESNQKAGLLSAMLTVEEGSVIKGSMDNLDKLYDMGVRMLTLTWNYSNEIGYPNSNLRAFHYTRPEGFGYTADTENGLTAFGKEVAAHMQDLGMIVDTSHLSDAGFYDVLDCTSKPFVGSHSNARGMCSHVRNMTDDMLRKLAERGGVTGLNFCSSFMEDVPKGCDNPGTMEAIARQAHYIANIGGIECLGLGSDFDGISTNQAITGVHEMPKLWDALHKSGFTENELDHIFYKNVLRLYKDCL